MGGAEGAHLKLRLVKGSASSYPAFQQVFLKVSYKQLQSYHASIGEEVPK